MFGALQVIRRLAPVLAVPALCLAGPPQTQHNHIRYYIQLVRATDSSQPPQSGSRPVGAKLATTLHGPLRWKHYWEICRREADVPFGGTATLRLPNQRAVEIDLTRPGRRSATAFQHGKPVDRTVVPIGEAFTLIGGDRDDSTAWFIVVRRDKPGA